MPAYRFSLFRNVVFSLWKGKSIWTFSFRVRGEWTNERHLCFATTCWMRWGPCSVSWNWWSLHHPWSDSSCLSSDVRSSDCCLDRYKSRACSFRSSFMIQCVSLPSVPEQRETLSLKETEIDVFSSEGNYSYDKWIRSLCAGSVGTGISSE